MTPVPPVPPVPGGEVRKELETPTTEPRAASADLWPSVLTCVSTLTCSGEPAPPCFHSRARPASRRHLSTH